MTIEQANAAALAASMAGDLGALKRALSDRAAAILELLQSAPSEELAMRVRNAIHAGEFVHRDLCAIQARVEQLRSGLAPEPVADPHIDLRG